MSVQWYEALAWLMRYWFAALAIVTVYRALRWMLTDASLRRKAIRALPDAGYIGHLLVLSGESRSLSPGDEIQLPCEGTLGYSRRCDVCIRHKSLFSREAFFWLEQDGLHMSPIHSGSFIVDGQQVGAGDEAVLLSGAQLLIGEVAIELKLLKGLQLDGVFEQPLEPYVTPERRKRAKKATQRAASAGKRAAAKKPRAASSAAGPSKAAGAAKPAESAKARARTASAKPEGELQSTPRPRRARQTPNVSGKAGAKAAEKSAEKSGAKAPSSKSASSQSASSKSAAARKPAAEPSVPRTQHRHLDPPDA